MRIFLTLFLLIPSLASAALEDELISNLNSRGIKCLPLPANASSIEGYSCAKNFELGVNYYLIPRGLSSLKKLIFYAHGDTGQCGNGASGENFLWDKFPILRDRNAVAYFPYRSNQARNMSFDLATQIRNMEDGLGVKNIPWTLVGHSYGGKFIARQLVAYPSVIGKVQEIVLLDATYDIDTILYPNLKIAMTNGPRIRVRALSSTTYENGKALQALMNNEFPNRFTLEKITGEHCEAPKFFSRL